MPLFNFKKSLVFVLIFLFSTINYLLGQQKTVPVVFHVISPNAVNHTTQERASELLESLNAGYSNTNIQFELANYYFYPNEPVLSSLDETKFQDVSNFSRLNTNFYLNIWILNFISLNGEEENGRAFYAPSHGSSLDGVYLNRVDLDNTTLIHEVGHYFNLYHPWEKFNFNSDESYPRCNESDKSFQGDFVADIPPMRFSRFIGCNWSLYNSIVQCGFNPSAVNNYMTYNTHNSCRATFSQGQVNRINTFSSITRGTLGQNCCPIGQLTILNPFGANRLNRIPFLEQGLASIGVSLPPESYLSNSRTHIYWEDSRYNDNIERQVDIRLFDSENNLIEEILNISTNNTSVNRLAWTIPEISESEIRVSLKFYEAGTGINSQAISETPSFFITNANIEAEIENTNLNTAGQIKVNSSLINEPLKIELSIDGGHNFSELLTNNYIPLDYTSFYTWNTTNNFNLITDNAQVRISSVNDNAITGVSNFFKIEGYDFCEGAQDIIVQSEPCVFTNADLSETEFFFYNSTKSGNNPTCGTPLTGDIWGRLYVPPSGKVVIEARGSNQDGQLAMAVYDACGNAQSDQIACVSSNPIRVELDAQDGISPEQELYVRLWYVNTVYEDKHFAVVCAYAPDGGAAPTCNDGIQNGTETGIDCGGSCTACPTTGNCDNGIQDGNETGIDCGGSTCPACNISPNLKINYSSIASNSTIDPSTGFDFSIEVKNASTQAIAAALSPKARFYISTDATPSDNEQLCNDYTITAKTSNATQTITCNVAALSGVFGDRFLIVEVDAYDAVNEDDENDNRLVIPIRVAPVNGNLPDMVINSAATNKSLISPGESFQVNLSYANEGNLQNFGYQNSSNNIYLTDGTNETKIGDFSMVSRSANSLPHSESVAVTLPNSLNGSGYSIKIVLDENNAILENEETNNTYIIPITVNNSPPAASFYASQTTACVGQTIFFYNGNFGATNTTFNWTFSGADTPTSTAAEPAVTYGSPGTYTVSMTVTNANGTSTPETKTNYITILPANSGGGNTTDVLAGINTNEITNITPFNATPPTILPDDFYTVGNVVVPHANGYAQYKISPFQLNQTFSGGPVYDAAFENGYALVPQFGSVLRRYTVSSTNLISPVFISSGFAGSIHRIATTNILECSSTNTTRLAAFAMSYNKIRVMYNFNSTPVWSAQAAIGNTINYVGGDIYQPDSRYGYFYVAREGKFYTYLANTCPSASPPAPSQIRSLNLAGNAMEIIAPYNISDYIYVILDNGKVAVINISNNSFPSLVKTVDLTNLSISHSGTYYLSISADRYLLVGGKGTNSNITALNLTDPANPVEEAFNDDNIYESNETTKEVYGMLCSNTSSQQYKCYAIDNFGVMRQFEVGTTQVEDCSTITSPTITANGSTAICQDNSVTLSAPNGFSTYTWSNGATTQNIEVTQAGTYSVQVSTCGGCTATSNAITVTVGNGLNVNVTKYDATCENNNGYINLAISGGGGNYIYTWSDNSTVATRSGLSAGIYEVTIASGTCTKEEQIILTNTGTLPTANFTVTVEKRSVSISDQSVGANTTNYTFGDGNNTSVNSPFYTYPSDGVYTICQNVTNDCGSDQFCQQVTVMEFVSCRERDSLELVKFYNATNGATWTNKWNLNTPIDTWYGIGINAEGCVICIDMDGNPQCEGSYFGPGNNVSGTLPNLNLSALRWFDVSRNQISGAIPSFSNSLELIHLNLAENELSGTIPDFQLPNLDNLRLGRNNLTGSIPDFTGMPVIGWIGLENNNLYGSVPPLRNCSKLGSLHLENNDLTGSIPDFSNFPDLYDVVLNNNNLTTGDFDLMGAGGFYGMRLVRLNSNLLTDLPNLSHITYWNSNFKEVNVSNNQLTFEDILPNMGLASYTDWTYAPQAKVFEPKTIILSEGENVVLDLNIDNGITSNLYNWYFNESLFVSTNDPDLTLFNLPSPFEGTFHCVVTNPNAPDLTLTSHDISLVVSSEPLNNCSGEDLVINYSVDGVYKIKNTITSTALISGTTSYKAGRNITLNPGFHAEVGSNFLAKIEDCDLFNFQTNEMEAVERINFNIPETATTNILPALTLKIAPNPVTTNTNIIYQLPQSSNVQLGVYNLNGQEMKQISLGQKGVGEHRYQLNMEALVSGIYFVLLKTDDGSMKSQKMVVR